MSKSILSCNFKENEPALKSTKNLSSIKVHLSGKFHQNPSVTFDDILLINRQTNANENTISCFVEVIITGESLYKRVLTVLHPEGAVGKSWVTFAIILDSRTAIPVCVSQADKRNKS